MTNDNLTLNSLQVGDIFEFLDADDDVPNEYVFLEIRSGGLGNYDVKVLVTIDGVPQVKFMRLLDPRTPISLLERAGSLVIEMPDSSKWSVPMTWLKWSLEERNLGSSSHEVCISSVSDHLTWKEIEHVVTRVKRGNLEALYTESFQEAPKKIIKS